MGKENNEMEENNDFENEENEKNKSDNVEETSMGVSIKPRKQYIMTDARKKALEKANLARNRNMKYRQELKTKYDSINKELNEIYDMKIKKFDLNDIEKDYLTKEPEQEQEIVQEEVEKPAKKVKFSKKSKKYKDESSDEDEEESDDESSDESEESSEESSSDSSESDDYSSKNKRRKTDKKKKSIKLRNKKIKKSKMPKNAKRYVDLRAMHTRPAAISYSINKRVF